MLKFAYVKGTRNMKRAEALKHFEEEYIMPYYIKMDEDMDKYIDENRKGLTASFIENFRTLCKKIKEMQDKGKKGKIAYIIYSFNIQNLQKESRDYVVQAYGTEWFLEEGEECKIKYGVGWIYDLLDNTYKKLVEISKKYIGNINSADLESVWKDGIKYCDVSLLKFAKKAIKEAIQIDEFKAIYKEEVLEIRLGEHKGYNEIIYKMDTRIKDSKEMKHWLESEEKTYSYSILQKLDLSGGRYDGITCNNSDFSGSDLSNSSFEGASLIESVFVKSIINKVNFKKAALFQGDMHDTVIVSSDFEDTDMMYADFSNSEFIECNLSNSTFSRGNFHSCKFEKSTLNKVKFGKANLENVDFGKSSLRDSTFSGTNLKGANLSGADLTNVSFVKVDLTQAKIDNAIFGNNKFKDVKIRTKYVEMLNLSEDQRKGLIITG
jgi:uncharacterized protein YjbI with pentapeptide repeats